MPVPGHHDQEERPINVNDGTTARTASRPAGGVVYLPDESISFELSDAPKVCVPTSLSAISLAEMRVLAWLRMHAETIAETERRFSVDRRAIAGVIAWEALKNVHWTSLRAVGPGKAHVRDIRLAWAFLPVLTHHTLVAQVEERGVLPKQSVEGRAKLLLTPEGAITYIGAAMQIASDMAEQHGFDSIRRRPDVLSYFWNSKDLDSWEKLLKSKKPGDRFVPQTDMAIWVQKNNTFLEDGVGKPDWSVLNAKQGRAR
jgi:hypothetical protein